MTKEQHAKALIMLKELAKTVSRPNLDRVRILTMQHLYELKGWVELYQHFTKLNEQIQDKYLLNTEIDDEEE